MTSATVELPYKNLVDWEMGITLKQEVLDWLRANVGLGDTRWWNSIVELVFHLDHCENDGPGCISSGEQCVGHEDWGWVIATRTDNAFFVFRDPSRAVLFKLRWA